jgi:hypothetical protein
VSLFSRRQRAFSISEGVLEPQIRQSMKNSKLVLWRARIS